MSVIRRRQQTPTDHAIEDLLAIAADLYRTTGYTSATGEIDVPFSQLTSRALNGEFTTEDGE